MKLKLPLFILLLSLSFTQAMAQEFRIWSALQLGQKHMSNIDIERHIELTKVTPQSRAALFSLAKGDIYQYDQLKRQAYAHLFEPTLKELAYMALIERLALTQRNRAAFNTTVEQYRQALQDHEGQELREWLTQGLGIVRAREEFGARLRTQNFPHLNTESDNEIYWRWYEEQRYIIKEKMRMREVARFESYKGSSNINFDTTRAVQIGDLTHRLITLVGNGLQGKAMSAQQVQSFRAQHPELELIIKDVRLLSLAHTPLAFVHRIQNESRLEQMRAMINNNFNPQIGQERVARVLHYESSAQTLASRYTKTQLEELTKQRMDSFIAGGPYEDFMMARLYHLAQLQIEHNPDLEATRIILQLKLQEAFDWLKRQNLRNDFYLSNDVQNLLFEDAVARKLTQYLELETQNDPYLRAALDMGIWIAKFEAKKVAGQDRTIVWVDHHTSRSTGLYDRLDDHIKRQEFNSNLERFRRDELSRHTHLLQINPGYGGTLYGAEAWQFIN